MAGLVEYIPLHSMPKGPCPGLCTPQLTIRPNGGLWTVIRKSINIA